MMSPEIRTRFSRVLARPGVYLANHSLGRPLDQTAVDVQEALDLWYADLDGAWESWLGEMSRWRAGVARLIGLSRGDAIIPKSSAGQGLRAVLNAFPQDRPVRVVATRGEFDSVDFILKTYVERGRAEVAWIEPSAREGPVPLFEIEPMIAAMSGEPGLVVVSAVFFGTGQVLAGLSTLVDEAHRRGWLVLVDFYHAAGVAPVRFEELGVDFGIGGSYKYLRGGPGACWLAIHPRHLAPDSPLRSLDTGWFAKKETFGYLRGETAEFAEGGDGWLESTPAILAPYQARAGLGLTLEIGVERLRRDSLARQARMREMMPGLFEPANPEDYGAFSLLAHADAAGLSRELNGRGVVTDARGGFVRFGPDFLTTEEEMERAARALASVIGQ